MVSLVDPDQTVGAREVAPGRGSGAAPIAGRARGDDGRREADAHRDGQAGHHAVWSDAPEGDHGGAGHRKYGDQIYIPLPF